MIWGIIVLHIICTTPLMVPASKVALLNINYHYLCIIIIIIIIIVILLLVLLLLLLLLLLGFLHHVNVLIGSNGKSAS